MSSGGERPAAARQIGLSAGVARTGRRGGTREPMRR